MRKTIFLAGLAILLAATPLMAQMMEGGQMMGNQNPGETQQMMQPTVPAGEQNYPQYMTPCMMGGYGYGMGPGMMGYYSPEQYEKQYKDFQNFLDDTKELRRKLHAMKFDFAEARRNPATKPEDLEKMNTAMENLWKQIYEKRKSLSE